MKLQRAGIIGEFVSIFVNELVNSCLLIVLCLSLISVSYLLFCFTFGQWRISYCSPFPQKNCDGVRLNES